MDHRVSMEPTKAAIKVRFIIIMMIQKGLGLRTFVRFKNNLITSHWNQWKFKKVNSLKKSNQFYLFLFKRFFSFHCLYCVKCMQ